MSKRLTGRVREAEASRVLSNKSAKDAAINVSGNAAVNEVLNKQFTRQSGLSNRRQLRQTRINELNNDYVRATQDVLNDKTLDFLIKHSQIDAPTLTSIFAGFELAKASKANKLREQLDFTSEGINADNLRDSQKVQAQNELDNSRIGLIEDTRDRALQQTSDEAKATLQAVTGDIVSDERLAAAELVNSNRIAAAQLDNTNRVAAAQLDNTNRVNAAKALADSKNPNLNQLAAFRSISPVTTVPTTQGGGTTPDLVQPALLSPQQIDVLNLTTQLEHERINPNSINAPTLIGEGSDVNILTEEQQTRLNDIDRLEGGIEGEIERINSILPDRSIPSLGTGNDAIPFNDPTAPVVNSPTTDNQILFSDEVVDQIGFLNQSTTEIPVDPLQLQQTLISQGLDPSGLTVEQINELLRTNGVQ